MKIANYKTSNVGWVIDYNESKIETKTAARIGGNVAGNKQTVERIFNHFAFRRDTSGLKNRFIHLKLSLSPLDNTVSSKTFRSIAQKTLLGLGLQNNPYLIYRHYDTDHPHLHIVISRITFDGKLIRDSFDGLIMKKLERELDREFGLTSSYTRLLSPMGIRLPQKWERERSNRTGLKSVRNYIQCAIIESTQGKPSLTVFVKRLERRGVKIWHREIQRGLKIHHGLSYSLDPSLLSINFKDNNQTGFVSGMDTSKMGSVSDKTERQVDHKFFGMVSGRILNNLRGIPEFCINSTKPDNHMKPFSFRAANLGPFFQYESIIAQLSSKETDTYEYITHRTTKRITDEQYIREPLTSNERSAAKLIVAAELKSESRVNEALKEGIQVSELEKLDRSYTSDEQNFIRLVIEANVEPSRMKKNYNLPGIGIDAYAKLILQYGNLTDESPNLATIKAIHLISEKDWTLLEKLLTSTISNNEKNSAPDPSIMYLGLPTSLSYLMMDYHEWYSNQSVSLNEDSESSKRRRILKDTEALLSHLKLFDEGKVKEILLTGMPDVTKIPMEHLGKVTDPELVKLLKGLVSEVQLQNKIDDSSKKTKQVKDEDRSTSINHSKERGYEIG